MASKVYTAQEMREMADEFDNDTICTTAAAMLRQAADAMEKIEYMLYYRTTHKNGRVGNWVVDFVSSDPKMIKLCVKSDRRRAERLGKKVEHRVRVREVSSWYEDDLDKVLKLAENKEVKDGE